MEKTERQQIKKLIQREVIPAIGCTEPAAVALCVAKATETLGCCPEKIEVQLSANMLKNAMGVGIPGTGMSGLPIAIALGALIGKSAYQLEVLRDCTPEAVAAGRAYIAEKRISIKLKTACDKLYIEVRCAARSESARCIIVGTHTNIVTVEKNGKSIGAPMRASQAAGTHHTDADPKLTMHKVFDYATTAPLDELEFIMDAATLNTRAAEVSLQGCYGHRLGRTISELNDNLLGNSVYAHILAVTSAACDARMDGAMIPVMSNSGSGNQGIAATLPVVAFAKDNGNSRDALVRALTLSHLTVIYTKQSLGRLSALCGCVVAAIGASCGITLLMGGDYHQVCAAVKNMIGNITGMICDGAKPSCAMKVASGVSSAVLSAMLAMHGQCVTDMEGIVDNDIDRCIENLTRIGREGMCATDQLVLQIMTEKDHAAR